MDKFFELISKLKELGIAAKLCSVSSANALREEWNKFLSENSELVEEIKAWGQEFAINEDSEPIFKESAVIEDSKEVVIVIRVCDDTTYVSECEICEDCTDLEKSLVDTGEKVAMAVAGISSEEYEMISEITAERIFDYIQEKLAEKDADADESESEEDSDDGEDATEETAAEAEDSDDGEETETKDEDVDADESYGADESESGINLAEAEDH